MYEFRPFSEDVTALRLGARRRSTGLYACVLQGVRTLVHVEGVAYIECASTPASPRYKGFKVHQEGALLVTSVIKCYKWLLSLGVNARPLLCRVTLDLLSVECFLLRSSDLDSSEWKCFWSSG